MALVMAGGQGSRLLPLTDKRSKPAVPFGSRYRIVDFVLSNLVNSDIFTIYLLVQYKSQSLIEHVRKAWVLSPLFHEQFVTVVPPQMQEGTNWYAGTADAVFQNLSLVETHHPDLVLVFGADHVYRMDIGQMIDFHLEREAEITVAALPVPLADASSFGVIRVDQDNRILGFDEKPERPVPMPPDPGRAYASMGNYVFNAGVLMHELREANRRGETDFGGHVLPRLLERRRVFAYNFGDNAVPGIKDHEEPHYWRDVGTIDAYFEAHRDVLGLTPRLDLFNPQWPILSSHYQGPVARVVRGEIENSLLGAATVIDGGRLSHTIVRREAVIEEGAELTNCVVMDYVRVGRGARIRNAIIDRHNVIEAGAEIGLDPEADRQRYPVSPGGVVVLPRGRTPFFARDSRGEHGPGYAE
jgi:glucose-1-phosphate adenylyltransferase